MKKASPDASDQPEETPRDTDLPRQWTSASLADVVEPGALIQYGILQPGPNVQGGVPYIRPTEIRSGVIDAENLLRTSDAIARNYARSSLKPGDVVLSIVGTIGKVAIVPDSLDGANITQSSARLRPCRTLVSSEFLALFLRSPVARQQFDAARLGTGVPRLNIGDIRQFALPLPPPSEQKRIVAKVEELTARSRRAKEALDAVPALLDQLRQSILAAAFRGDLSADWRAKNPDVDPGERFLARIRAERQVRRDAAKVTRGAARGKRPSGNPSKEENAEPSSAEVDRLSDLPTGWCWATVEAAGDVHLGRMRSPDKHGGDNVRPYLRVMNVHEDRIDVSDVMAMQFEPEEFEFYRLLPGDVLLNEGQSKELIGRPAMFRGELPDVAFTNSLIRFRPYGGAPPEYALALFRHYMRSGRFQKIAQITTNIAHLGATRFRELEYPIPPLEEQKIIATTVMRLLAGVDALQERLNAARERCATLERSILKKAFRGELVQQDLKNEPASVLLERIRAARDIGEPRGSRTSRQSRKAESITEGSENDADENAITPIRLGTAGRTSKDLSGIERETLLDEVYAALWTAGPLDKDEAIRRVADHLRQAGYVQFERLRTDGPLFGQVLEAIESAVKAGRLDRPKRGHVRACKADAATYSADDWRLALVASLGTGPMDRDEAIRAAAEWARDNLGVDFARLRGDGNIVEGLRSAINSAIRRGDVIRHDAKRIVRASVVQPGLPRVGHGPNLLD